MAQPDRLVIVGHGSDIGRAPDRPCWSCAWFAALFESGSAACANPGCSACCAQPERGCASWEPETFFSTRKPPVLAEWMPATVYRVSP